MITYTTTSNKIIDVYLKRSDNVMFASVLLRWSFLKKLYRIVLYSKQNSGAI
jgi:hypothetical protein